MTTLFGVLAVFVLMLVGILGIWAAAIRARRAEMMPTVARRLGLGFSEVDIFNTAAAPFDVFRAGDGRRIQNVMWKEEPGHPRAFEYGYYKLHTDNNGNQYERWEWFTCALAQHNGKWPELRVAREHLVDRAARTLGRPDIELESEEFNRAYVVQCEDPKFATDVLDPQMMEFISGTDALVEFRTSGRFLLLTTGQVQTAEAMAGLLGVAEGFVARVPPVVWDLYGRFPDGMGTEDMPPPHPAGRPATSGLLAGGGEVPEPFEFAPAPDLHHIDAAWDPTPDVDYDLDGRPVVEMKEDPWGEGRSRAP